MLNQNAYPSKEAVNRACLLFSGYYVLEHCNVEREDRLHGRGCFLRPFSRNEKMDCVLLGAKIEVQTFLNVH